MTLTGLFITSVDPSLGRVDKSSLPQGTLMELFTANIAPRNVIFDAKQDDPIRQWKHTNINADNEITEIWWYFYDLKGTIDIQWLPSTIKILDLELNGLKGTVDLSRLPPAMKNLILRQNDFSGSADLTQLPSRMVLLNLSCNLFSGTINLTRLPNTLMTLELESNSFSGLTDFSQLPQSLVFLNLSMTDLEGEIRRTAVGTLKVDDSHVQLIE